MLERAEVTYGSEELLDGLVLRWVEDLNLGVSGEVLLQLLDALDSSGVILVGLEVGNVGNGHGQATGDSQLAAGGVATAEVLADNHSMVVAVAVTTFNASSVLQLANGAVRTSDLLPEHRANVRCGLGERTGSAAQVGLLVGGDRRLVSAVPVVGCNVGVLDNNVGVGVILKVVADRKVDPLSTVDHIHAIRCAGLDDVELVRWSNTGAEQDLGGTEGTGRQDDTTSAGCNIDGTTEAVGAVVLHFNTSDMASVTDDTVDCGVHP